MRLVETAISDRENGNLRFSHIRKVLALLLSVSEDRMSR